jgi:phosphoribosylaminoimidazolecarboxamide formyltransferase/IMP cyclohydrolase
VTKSQNLPEHAIRDMVVALITLKYTQSNSVCLTKDGQVIGNGAGQQSRIHCTRIAADKADFWHLRQHPRVLDLQFKDGDRVDRDNAIDRFVREELTHDEKHEWLEGVNGVTLGSDAYFPFRDNIDRARNSGVQFIVQPGGSVRDADVISACDEYDIVMVLTGTRLFQH